MVQQNYASCIQAVYYWVMKIPLLPPKNARNQTQLFSKINKIKYDLKDTH